MTQPPRGQPYVRQYEPGLAPQSAAGQLPQHGQPSFAATATFSDYGVLQQYGQWQIPTKRPNSGPWVIVAVVVVTAAITLTLVLVLNRGSSLVASTASPEEVTTSFLNAVNGGHKTEALGYVCDLLSSYVDAQMGPDTADSEFNDGSGSSYDNVGAAAINGNSATVPVTYLAADSGYPINIQLIIEGGSWKVCSLGN